MEKVSGWMAHLLLLNVVDLDLSGGLRKMERRKRREEGQRGETGGKDKRVSSRSERRQIVRREREREIHTSPAASKSPAGLKFNAYTAPLFSENVTHGASELNFSMLLEPRTKSWMVLDWQKKRRKGSGSNGR